MLKHEEWLDLARKLDWEYSYVSERDVFPDVAAGSPWLPQAAWKNWDEPYRTTYSDYVSLQHEKDLSVFAVKEAVGNIGDFQKRSLPWLNSLKLHSALLPLAEFAAVIGNMRAARFGRDSAWRNTALFGALDELRHTQIPLLLNHDLVKWDKQFDWTHKFYHTDNWISIAARHMFDELLLASNPIEFALGTNFVFETGFTNVQFIGLSAMADLEGDRMFEKMVNSIQTDEARHSQIGLAVLEVLAKHDPDYAQYLLDKWFWRGWLLFAILTGFSMDYLTPLEHRQQSFKEFMQEWILDQFLRTIQELGLKKPWYWDTFLDQIEIYHHMVYASAYTHRATTWFDFVVPGPEERKWLKSKYPKYWDEMDKVWDQIALRWKLSDPGTEWWVHGATPVAFCNLCQIVLCGGNPHENTANTLLHNGRRYIFCSDPCRWIFEKENVRYEKHLNVVDRILAGIAPANLLELVRKYFSLSPEVWGKDAFHGEYPWLKRDRETHAK